MMWQCQIIIEATVPIFVISIKMDSFGSLYTHIMPQALKQLNSHISSNSASGCLDPFQLEKFVGAFVSPDGVNDFSLDIHSM